MTGPVKVSAASDIGRAATQAAAAPAEASDGCYICQKTGGARRSLVAFGVERLTLKYRLSKQNMKKRLTTFLGLFVCLLAVHLTACHAGDTRSVTLVGYNYTDRPIGGFSVNGVGGSNVAVLHKEGGGGMSCCVDVTVGQTVKIKWRYHRTKKQREAGMPIEDRETTAMVPLPQRPEANYLEVHFYPDHHVELALVNFPGKARWDEIPNHGVLYE